MVLSNSCCCFSSLAYSSHAQAKLAHTSVQMVKQGLYLEFIDIPIQDGADFLMLFLVSA
jgi:hypothetical protein